MQAAADELGVTKEQLAEWTVESSGQTPADEGEEAMSEEVRTKLEDIRAVADGMTDADVVARYMEKYPNLKGCFAVMPMRFYWQWMLLRQQKMKKISC